MAAVHSRKGTLKMRKQIQHNPADFRWNITRTGALHQTGHRLVIRHSSVEKAG